MTASLECVLIVFLITLIVVLIVLAVSLSKLIDEAVCAVRSINRLAELAERELEPALKSANNIIKTADSVRKIPLALIGAIGGAFAAFKSRGGFLCGLTSGFNLVKKRR